MSNPLQRRPQGIIFDLDGTLLDTEPLYTEATQKVLDPFGHTYSMELKKRCMGGDSRLSAQMTIDEYDLPMSVDEYLSIRNVYLMELFPTSPEIKGAGEFVSALANEKILVGLATSSHKPLCDIKLSSKDWGSSFHSIVCGDNQAVKKGKPEPDIFLVCADLLNIPAGNCVVFEDSPTGIKAARSAGMRVIAINSQYVDLADLHEAEIIIDSYHELLPLISSWSR
jgi:pseudouridine-5'-monophosphatase